MNYENLLPVVCVECGERLGWVPVPAGSSTTKVDAHCDQCKYEYAAGRRGEDD